MPRIAQRLVGDGARWSLVSPKRLTPGMSRTTRSGNTRSIATLNLISVIPGEKRNGASGFAADGTFLREAIDMFGVLLE